MMNLNFEHWLQMQKSEFCRDCMRYKRHKPMVLCSVNCGGDNCDDYTNELCNECAEATDHCECCGGGPIDEYAEVEICDVCPIDEFIRFIRDSKDVKIC